jgi:L-xylulokinase
MMSKYLLGLDNGGTVTKAAIFDLNGNEISAAGRRCDVLIPNPGFVERDMNELWDMNVSVIREAMDAGNIDGPEIIGVGVTGFGNGLLPVDENGLPARPVILSSDVRAQGIVDRWRENGVSDVIRARAGHTAWAGQPCPLIVWLKAREPEIIDRARWFLSCKDYIRYRLTGEIFSEYTDLSGIGVVDMNTFTISDDILSAAGLSDQRRKFPPVRKSEDICGRVTDAAARVTGLLPGTPVAGGSMDIHACALSGGLLDEIPINIVVGTWGIHQYLSKHRVEIENLFMTSLSYLPDYYLITEASPTCTNNLEWYIANLLTEKTHDDVGSVYAHCDNLVEKIIGDDSDVIFLPFLYSTNGAPGADAAFLGLSSWHSGAHMLRAVYEGIAFSSRYHTERLLSRRKDARERCVRMVGGASRSRILMRIYADVLKIPMEMMGGTFERGALGAAVIAGVACGAFDSFEDAVRDMVRVAYRLSPDAGMGRYYDEKYEKYKRAMDVIGAYSNPAGNGRNI